MSSPTPKPMLSDMYLKPLATTGVAVLLDRMVLRQTDMTKNLSFGLSVGLGVGLGSMIAQNLPIADSPSSFGNGKQIASRLLEITAGTGTAYAVNRWVMKNDTGTGMIRKVGVIFASDFLGEYITDYASGRSLGFFV